MAAIAVKAKDSSKLQQTLIHGSMPVALIGILGIMIFPMPTIFLDVCLALNITISLVVLFVCLYIDKPLRFSSFRSRDSGLR